LKPFTAAIAENAEEKRKLGAPLLTEEKVFLGVLCVLGGK